MLIPQLSYLLLIIPTIFAISLGESESESEEPGYVERRVKRNDKYGRCVDECFVKNVAVGSIKFSELRQICEENCGKESADVFHRVRQNGGSVDPEDFHREPQPIYSSNFNCEMKCKANRDDVFRSMGAKKHNKVCKALCKGF